MNPQTPQHVRLNKHLVDLGLADSRRKADESIEAGQVLVNGIVASVGTKVLTTDSVTYKGKSGTKREHITIRFNKPVGYVSSHVAEPTEKTLFKLLPKSFAHLKIAGRLDKDSHGLMILSSDGQLVQRLSHPSNGKLKEYVVMLNKEFATVDKPKLTTGVKLDDGLSTFVSAKQLAPKRLRVTLREGRNRQVRRTFEALGYVVTDLERTQLGTTQLGRLMSGTFEFIHNSEDL